MVFFFYKRRRKGIEDNISIKEGKFVSIKKRACRVDMRYFAFKVLFRLIK